MNWPRRSLWVSIMIALCFTAALPARANLPDSLTEIGAARLKVFFWTIYDCYLYSKDGIYRGLEPNLTLELIIAGVSEEKTSWTVPVRNGKSRDFIQRPLNSGWTSSMTCGPT